MLLIQSLYASLLRLKQARKLVLCCCTTAETASDTLQFVLQNKVYDFKGLKYGQNGQTL